MKPTAYATPNGRALFVVTYSDLRRSDDDMPYWYLEMLAAQGYRVEVAAGPTMAAHVIED